MNECKKYVIASFSELCNCVTRSHFALYVCMYLHVCQSRLGPGACQVTSYASAARVTWLHGLCPRVCRVVTWFATVRVLLGYMVCPSPSPSCTACGWIRELQHCSVASNIH